MLCARHDGKWLTLACNGAPLSDEPVPACAGPLAERFQPLPGKRFETPLSHDTLASRGDSLDARDPARCAHALDYRALEVHAVDYLLKPVNAVRLAKTLQHVRESAAGERDEAVDRVLRAGPQPRPRFLAKHGGRFRVVPQEEVSYLSIQDGLTAVHTAGTACWIDLSLAELERRLDPAEFVRISRETIVRVGAIAEVLPLVGGYAEVILRTGERLTVSRRRTRELMETLTGGI